MNPAGDALPDEPSAELPEVLVELAAEQLLAVRGEERLAVLASLQAQFPGHRAALALLGAEIGCADGLLLSAFPDAHRHAPRQIAAHRVLRTLGEGAFGIVYLCAQHEPVVREVAIKVLKNITAGERALRRFAAERQLLATLNHPAITQVFDAGCLPDGRPYLVMEYVDGLPLRAYCERHELPWRERVSLFAAVCRGVAHAHQRGIVHRDLKPGNVLIVDGDAGPAPKIIDFGVAKALFESDHPATRTADGQVIGTPGYMSPEQTNGMSGAIDERADVFALGVMLYELLTGELPWRQGVAPDGAEPQVPSRRVAATTTAMPGRATTRRQLVAALRGDLDWITLKALAVARDERYDSAAPLAEDLERHLRGETVSVGPPSWRYRLGKLLHRHRTAALAILGGLVLGGGGLLAALVSRRTAAADVEAAERIAAARAGQAKAAIARLLVGAEDPRLHDGPTGDVARRALLQDAIGFYELLLRDQPADAEARTGHCRALLSLAQVHQQLGDPVRAAEIAGEALSEAEQLAQGAPADPQLRALIGDCLRRRGRSLAAAGSRADAHPLLVRAAQELAPCAAAAPTEHGRAYLGALREAADTLPQAAGAERLVALRRCLDACAELRTAAPPVAGIEEDHALASITLAVQLSNSGAAAEAVAVLAQAEPDLAALGLQRNAIESKLRDAQSRATWELGDRPGAIAYQRQAVAAAERWQRDEPEWSPPCEELVRRLRDLAICENYVGDFFASNAAFDRAIAQAEATVRRFPADPSRIATLCALLRRATHVLWDRFRREDLAAAERYAARAIAVNEQIPAGVDTNRQPRWLLSAAQAEIRTAAGENADELWQRLEPDLPSTTGGLPAEHQDQLAAALVALMNWHARNDRVEAAALVAQRVRAAVADTAPRNDKLLVDVGWFVARRAAAAGDHAGAAAAAADIVAARGTWFGHWRAGDALFLAWRTATDAGATAAASSHAERAEQHYRNVIDTLQQDVVDTPLDPWYVVPWGSALLRTAELCAAADRQRALTLLGDALPRLAAVRASAVADTWDEALITAGLELQQRLIAAK